MLDVIVVDDAFLRIAFVVLVACICAHFSNDLHRNLVGLDFDFVSRLFELGDVLMFHPIRARITLLLSRDAKLLLHGRIFERHVLNEVDCDVMAQFFGLQSHDT